MDVDAPFTVDTDLRLGLSPRPWLRGRGADVRVRRGIDERDFHSGLSTIAAALPHPTPTRVGTGPAHPGSRAGDAHPPSRSAHE